MPRKSARRGRKKKRKANSGSFQAGPDSRRHVFSRAEQQLGYARCMLGKGKCSDPHVFAWVWRKVRSYYRKEAHSGPETARAGGAGDDAPI